MHIGKCLIEDATKKAVGGVEFFNLKSLFYFIILFPGYCYGNPLELSGLWRDLLVLIDVFLYIMLFEEFLENFDKENKKFCCLE